MKKKLLIISQYFEPDITAAAYRMGDMYRAMPKGYSVDVLTTYPHKSKEKASEDEENIYRINVKGKSKNKYLKYLNEYFGFMFKAIFKAKTLKPHYDYIFVTSPPIFSLVAGYIIAKQKKGRLIIDIRDIWPDVLIDDGTLSEKSILFKIVKRFELFIYKNADAITCVSKYMGEYIKGICGKNVTVIYNGISVISQETNKKFKGRNITSRNEKLNLFYAGNLGFFQHLGVLMEVFKDVEIQKKYNLDLIGGGSLELKIRHFIEVNNLQKCIFLKEPMDKKMLFSTVFNKADILFLNLYDSKTLRRTIPSKLFDYLYFNLPIIYGMKGEGKEILDSLKCGEYFIWDNAESLKSVMLQMYDSYYYYFENAKGNERYVCDKFDREKMFADFWNDMEQVKLCV